MKLWWHHCFDDPEADTFGEPSSELEVLIEHLRPRSTILDVGCGEGRNALFLASHGHTVFGFDLSRAAIGKTLRRARNIEDSIRAWVQDVRGVELRRRFDVVLCQGLLHFLTPLPRDDVLRRLRSLTLPAGFNVISAFTTRVPPPDDMAPALVGLFDEGEIRTSYRGWEEIMWRGYVYDDEHPGGLRHTHAIEKVIARRPQLGTKNTQVIS